MARPGEGGGACRIDLGVARLAHANFSLRGRVELLSILDLVHGDPRRRPAVTPPGQSDVHLVLADAIRVVGSAHVALEQHPAVCALADSEVLHHVLVTTIAVEWAAGGGTARARVHDELSAVIPHQFVAQHLRGAALGKRNLGHHAQGELQGNISACAEIPAVLREGVLGGLGGLGLEVPQILPPLHRSSPSRGHQGGRHNQRT
mmetsp:Transcript_178689/g.572790  ORF Transcript_178689/g.572790 Transcript_178689/m.572790 type:complete len:204 (-) Transcript_178689:128-739(-)